MQKKVYQKLSFKILITVIILNILIIPIDMQLQDSISKQDVNNIIKYDVGDTISNGAIVVDKSNIIKVPLINHLNYISDSYNSGDYFEIFESLLTGVINTPIIHFAGENINNKGVVEGMEGLGTLKVENNQIIGENSNTFVWCYKVPEQYVIKTEKGIDIKENNTVIKSVDKKDFKKETLETDQTNWTNIEKWYNESKVGMNMTVRSKLTDFNDDRNDISADDLNKTLNTSILDYIKKYPDYSPVMINMHNYTMNKISNSYSYLGSHPEYGDYNRALNAKMFAGAWNGTIIPEHTNSSGHGNVTFVSCRDPAAPGGYASHGVCPAARTLRAVTTDVGFDLPVGISWEYDCVMYGFNPATGIKVSNSKDYPVFIKMYTEGNITNTIIYSELYELRPNN